MYSGHKSTTRVTAHLTLPVYIYIYTYIHTVIISYMNIPVHKTEHNQNVLLEVKRKKER